MLAEVRGRLADAIGRRFGRDAQTPGDAFLDHRLGLGLGQFEAGLLHELAELVDAGLGVFFLDALAVGLDEPLPGLGDRRRSAASLRLISAPRTWTSASLLRGPAPGGDGPVRELIVRGHGIAGPLEVLVRRIRGFELQRRRPRCPSSTMARNSCSMTAGRRAC